MDGEVVGVGTSVLLGDIAEGLLPLVGDFSCFSCKTEDDVGDCVKGACTGFWVDGCEFGVILIAVEGVGAGSGIGIFFAVGRVVECWILGAGVLLV